MMEAKFGMLIVNVVDVWQVLMVPKEKAQDSSNRL